MNQHTPTVLRRRLADVRERTGLRFDVSLIAFNIMSADELGRVRALAAQAIESRKNANNIAVLLRGLQVPVTVFPLRL